MGGCLAMHIGFHVDQRLAGVFACSSFLNENSIVYNTLKTQQNAENLPKLLMFHGTKDDLVPLDWAESSCKQLKQLGVDGELRVLEDVPHKLRAHQLNELKEWIMDVLPPISTDLVPNRKKSLLVSHL